MKYGLLSIAAVAVFSIATLGASPVAAQCSGCGPKVSKLRRGGGMARKGGTIDPAGIPSWERAATGTVESATSEERPIVLYFPSENANDAEFYGKEIAELGKEKALFIKIPYTDDREESPWAGDSLVPTSRLLSDNPSRDYGVKTGEATVLVCDWYGNEYFRTDENAKRGQA